MTNQKKRQELYDILCKMGGIITDSNKNEFVFDMQSIKNMSEWMDFADENSEKYEKNYHYDTNLYKNEVILYIN